MENYQKIYQEIAAVYLDHIQQFGLPLAKPTAGTTPILAKAYGWKSPACQACRKGEHSASFYISLMCHRHCYYCFNPNQEHYHVFCQQTSDAAQLLYENYGRQGRTLEHIALTGGEPLLHRQETLAFLHTARKLYPKAYLRLYTAGDLLDEQYLYLLEQAGLQEIRCSIKLEDAASQRMTVYKNIALATQYIEKVMVEMPVIPGTKQQMTEVLLRLAADKIAGINLLEFCFPFHNATAFQQRGFQIKNPPFAIFYNYDYAGGLPIAGSEELCLELLRFAEDRQLPLGVHYCSLANKLTAQIFAQNAPYQHKIAYYFSPRDFFFKSIKVFGKDRDKIKHFFQIQHSTAYQENAAAAYLEFHPQFVPLLQTAGINCRIGISYYIVEQRDNTMCLREVALNARQLSEISLQTL